MKDVLRSWMEPVFAGLPIRPVTRRLVTALLWDLPLSIVCQADFGVESAHHYRALRALLMEVSDAAADEDGAGRASAALRKRIVELDAALGKGPALSALVKRHVPHYGDVQFQTVWDAL